MMETIRAEALHQVAARSMDTGLAVYLCSLDLGWTAIWAPKSPTFTTEEDRMAEE